MADYWFLEDSPELKVVKLLDVVKNAELPVFDSFCLVLGEMGFWYLAQTLQAATKEKDASSSPGKVSDGNNVLKEVLLLPKDDSAVKEDNVRLRRKVQYLKNEYTKRYNNTSHNHFVHLQLGKCKIINTNIVSHSDFTLKGHRANIIPVNVT
ncbi:hypothetical protein EOD39_21916 [Acipenser ruthenus]|uniref:Uncharacterized protein n=1 Tax=Acipenser ruthenus TaxID=7906 RepID=A0A444URD2_ACIRT|nr:hypothetical protein EOD39_21916 [Acipenser ruthenus]